MTEVLDNILPAIQILKFGGSSLNNADIILSNVSDIIKDRSNQYRLGVVLSAISGVTEFLIKSITLHTTLCEEDIDSTVDTFLSLHRVIVRQLAVKVQKFPLSKLNSQFLEISIKYKTLLQKIRLLRVCPINIYCQILSFGEHMSTYIINALLTGLEMNVLLIDSSKFIKTESSLKNSIPIMDEITSRFSSIIDQAFDVLVIAGFIGSDMQDNVTLLGRNSSDYSAAIMAQALKATRCEIWTDVNGLYTGNPSQIPEAKIISFINYKDAENLAQHGANVLHPKAISTLASCNIPLYIKNTYNPKESGTQISNISLKNINGIKNSDFIYVITSIDDVALINIHGHNISQEIFLHIMTIVSKYDNPLLIQLNYKCFLSFYIKANIVKLVEKELKDILSLEIKAKIIEKIDILLYQSIICVIGNNRSSNVGIPVNKLISAITEVDIVIKNIVQNSFKKSLFLIIDNKNLKKSLRIIHKSIFSTFNTKNLYIFGVGAIGAALLNLIKKEHERLKKNENIELKVVAIANSGKIIYSKEGINLNNWYEQLIKSDASSCLQTLLKNITKEDFSNGIFIDCTSSEKIAKGYLDIIRSNLHLVTANKKANSDSMRYYNTLRNVAKKTKKHFFYETNVGAGLPVIDTLKNLLKSGDELISFSGILSGSLSFIFGLLDDGMPFSQAVQIAYKKNFTEPDPRDDLSGLDVARKLLILSREIGFSNTLKDINLSPILPDDFNNGGTTKQFLSNICNLDNYFSHWSKTAQRNNQVLRFVGEITNKRCIVGIKEVDRSNSLYYVKDGENAFTFLTKYYSPIPLVVRGYGAGVKVTAAGVFAEILKICQN